jgi:hypothetical protein
VQYIEIMAPVARAASSSSSSSILSALEEQDGDLAQVEVYKVPRLVRHVAAKVPSDDAVPGGVVLLVELLLDVGGDVLLDVVLFERLRGAVDGVLLHLLGHVRILDDGLALGLRHDGDGLGGEEQVGEQGPAAGLESR